jgi:hypothetical protein
VSCLHLSGHSLLVEALLLTDLAFQVPHIFHIPAMYLLHMGIKIPLPHIGTVAFYAVMPRKRKGQTK